MIDISKIDWNQAWKEVELEKKEKNEFASCTERWKDRERCRKFNQKVQEDNWKRAWERIQVMKCTPSSRVLDIGAGPGTLAIPLSGIVRHVTAVEPSPGMLECLHENMKEREIINISTLQKNWEDVDPATDLDAPYDVVVASYSLGVQDLRAALEKMDEVSAKYAYIFWFAHLKSPRFQHYHAIWEDLFGISPSPRHTPNIIFNLLNQMGIYANVEISRTENITRFSSIGDAVADQRDALNLTDERQVSVLTEYLEKFLLKENRQYLLKSKSYQAKIWWEKES
ncbi:MAG: class I SAM-dependent methyltransferase [Methanoregula sp.]|jgi:ubiquinone/menaquinone biosynthesis C-methylase UbiE|uniref:class I SAM-dependent methyltransferase n=1 Tax=Methanoregula sp. TaxID=2052170 RepID=UPI0025DD2082|nr:class I SAM-dependent methyltransferase [Methanoregula sp.]MCK9630617.1 class I SAM-dependent methyltransferase [Methanoregula sp.]